MIDQALWALGRGTGVTALAFMTVALFLGIATRSGRPLVMLPRFAVADVHRFASLAGTLLVVLHMALLFFDPYAQLRLVDFIVPFLGAYRPLWLGLGTLAFDLLAVVIVTSLLRHRLGVRAFRAVALGDLRLVAGSHGARARERNRCRPRVVPAVRRLLRGHGVRRAGVAAARQLHRVRRHPNIGAPMTTSRRRRADRRPLSACSRRKARAWSNTNSGSGRCPSQPGRHWCPCSTGPD